ncbi:hypothetical protein VUJ46_12415 [Chryseobacterium sp. MYb264]|uniref:hypothetical protein n=1 Tax=Chryseobacterium sp. MYb264 TaxID=2745153 RepID=UPI002E0D6A14|nr:hypothetical protein VUJ46_12415 [Chryseobacterium sp. MYb264]
MKKISTISALLVAAFSWAQSWNINGNSGINSSTHFLGTTDAKDLILKSNNSERVNINSAGKVSIKQYSDVGISLETFGRLQLNTSTTSDGLQITNNKQMAAGRLGCRLDNCCLPTS